jgi:hypothetical protein
VDCPANPKLVINVLRRHQPESPPGGQHCRCHESGRFHVGILSFKAIKLTVKFNVAEIVEMNPEWVFARTNSAGTTLNHTTGATSAEANQELFIFRKDEDGKLKIARYSFSTTNPQSK